MKPCKMDADKLDVKDNTVVTTYRNAVDCLLRVLDILDAQRFGYKALTNRHFNDDQKWFLMHDVFGFRARKSQIWHISP